MAPQKKLLVLISGSDYSRSDCADVYKDTLCLFRFFEYKLCALEFEIYHLLLFCGLVFGAERLHEHESVFVRCSLLEVM